jgi:hypothetical protein
MEAKHRWAASVPNTMVFVLLVGLVVIWAHELQSDPVPLVASCRKPIQIACHRGIVLDHDIFAIKLIEIGQSPASHLYTGCVAVFLNSLLLTDAEVKENFSQEYGLYIIGDSTQGQDDWRDAVRHLLDEVKAGCTLFMEEAG